MDRRIRQLAEQVDAHHISRREFVRRTAADHRRYGGRARRAELDGARAGPQDPRVALQELRHRGQRHPRQAGRGLGQGAQGPGRVRLGDVRGSRAEVRRGHRGRQPARHRRDELPGAVAVSARAARRHASWPRTGRPAGRTAALRRARRAARRPVLRCPAAGLRRRLAHPQGHPGRRRASRCRSSTIPTSSRWPGSARTRRRICGASARR